MYQYIKRILDVLLSSIFLIFFWWILLLIGIMVKIKLGSPIIYTATRAGKIDDESGNECVFKLYKFRSMTDEKDGKGKLLDDTLRLTKFGRKLRATSLDELPEIINILKGDMSIVGPRPLPVIYLPYYTLEERRRHKVRPGLTGWAQINGRNSLSWEKKFQYDVYYVDNCSLFLDIKILLGTVIKVFKREGIGQGEEAPESLHVERETYRSNTEKGTKVK